MRLRLTTIASIIVLFSAGHLLAATVTEIVPRSAPNGARVLIVGSGFDSVGIEITFATDGGARTTAPLLARTATLLEVAVPSNAKSGDVRVTSNSASIAALPFTITVSPDLVRSATLAASPAGKDVLKQPHGPFVALPDGIVYVADTGHHQIKAVLPNGEVQRSAGTGKPGFVNGSSANAQFKEPRAIVIDRGRNVLYIADTGNHVIRALTLNGVVSTFAGSGRPEDRDGVGEQAGFKQPAGLALDRDGNLYVADTGNDKIRKISPAGVVTTFAGIGRPGLANGAAAQASFRAPEGLALTESGALFVADTGNHVIRKIENGVVSIFGGTGHPGSVDGAWGVAELKEPAAIALDENGDLLVADSGNHQIRRIANGVVTTIAGSGKPGYVDGVNLAKVELKQPSGIAREGAIYIADTKNDALRVIYSAVTATDLYPRSGDPNGGETVRLFGAGFVPGQTTVTFGGTAAAVTYVSSTELMMTTPAGAIGASTIGITTPGGMATLRDAFNYAPPFVAVRVTPSSSSLDPNQSQQMNAAGVSSGGAGTDITARVTWSSSDPTVATIDSAGLLRTLRSGSATITATFGALSGTAAVTVRDLSPVPPDPSTIAPPLHPGTSTSVFDSTAFLYTGPNAIQQGVAPGTIDPLRVSVLRGRALTRDGQPLPAAKITIADHPELGHTLSRADGRFDLAVNGGGDVVVHYEKAAFIPSQRQVRAPWQGYAAMGDVILMPFDPVVTAIEANATHPQVAHGSVSNDADGERQATMIFAPGTAASMVMPDGTSQPLSTLHVRATEYTVGPNGPKAMPASLPPQSGYTYCVELSVDEAVAAGARSVQFSRPVAYYVENFLEFPAGTRVPAASLDTVKNVWVPIDDGRVIRIVQTESGLARVDTDGDGVADDNGIDVIERQQLASLYKAGTSLWRVLMSHFTPHDLNWPFRPASASQAPSTSPVDFTVLVDCCRVSGSIIETENQNLGEVVPVSGTPFALHYSSDRTPGRIASRTLDIGLTQGTLPENVQRIEVAVTIAGATTTSTFIPAPNQTFRHVWNGRDAYGRTVTGSAPVSVSTTYFYPAEYMSPRVTTGGSFGLSGGVRIGVGVPSRGELGITRTWEGTMPGIWDATNQGLGGWTFTPHHYYDKGSRVLYRGDGTRKTDVDAIFGRSGVVRTIAGNRNDDPEWSGAGGPAVKSTISDVFAMAQAADGTLYVSGPDFVHKITPNGTLLRVAGKRPRPATPPPPSEVLTVRPAIDAQLYGDRGMSLGRDGTLYLAEYNLRVVRQITPDGNIRPFAGTGVTGPYVEGSPAASVNFQRPIDIAASPDGAVYIADEGLSRVFRVGPDGIVHTYAGDGTFGYSGDGGPATAAALNRPSALALGPDGSLYIADWSFHIRRVTPDGTITTVGGNGQQRDSGDGGPATQAGIGYGGGNNLTVGPDGSVYIGTFSGIRRIAPDGTIALFGGKPTGKWLTDDNAPATATSLYSVNTLVSGPDGRLSFSEWNENTVRRIVPVLPSSAVGSGELTIADGSLVYIFDSQGRHLRTLDADTALELYHFDYKGGVLSSMTDSDGNTIQFQLGGSSAAIVAPGGQRTDIQGTPYASQITTAPGESFTFTYTPDGLMTGMTDPRGMPATFSWNELGLLRRDADAGGGWKELQRTETANGYVVSLTTAEGRTTSYNVDRTDLGNVTRRIIGPAGLSSVVEHKIDGTSTNMLPDGTQVSSSQRPDLLWGMQSPFTSETKISFPSGRSVVSSVARNVEYENPADPSSPLIRTDTTTTAGKTFTRVFERATLTETLTSPAQRVVKRMFDDKGRTSTIKTISNWPAIADTTFEYDAHGRMSTVTQGARSQIFGYSDRHELTSVTDVLGRTFSFVYDSAGRVTREILPGSREIAFTYDANGNLTAITPPGRPQHLFDYTKVNLTSLYTPPPAVPGGATRYAYNKDRQLTSITEADGSEISLFYDGGGRLASVTWPETSLTYEYLAGGALGSVKGADSSLTYTYDGSLPTSVAWSGAVAGSVSWAYDSSLRLSSETAGGIAVSFTYDDDGIVTRSGAFNRYLTDNGLTDGTQMGLASDYFTYDEYGEPFEHGMYNDYGVWTNPGAFLYIEYGRDKGGRIEALTEWYVDGSSLASRYVYDQAGRLADATIGSTAVHYTYDANGNRLTREVSVSGGATVTETAAYDAQDRLIRYGDRQYSYDANGNPDSMTTLAGVTAYDYDTVGALRSVTLPNDRKIEYVLDGQGRRVGRKVDGALAQGWLYGNQVNIIAELNGSGTVTSRFVYVTRLNSPDYMIRGGVTYRMFTDHLGSPRLVINTATGAVVQAMQYDEFGNVLTDTNPGFQPFGFAGGLYDRDTGLVHFGAREYDPHTGRFFSKDPIGFAGGDANLYAYVLSDPINLIDPMGRSWLDDHSDEIATISAGIGDGILKTLSFGLFDGKAARAAYGSDQLVDMCSSSYKAARVAGTAIALAAYVGGAIPKTLTHFTTETSAMFIRGGGGIYPSTGFTLFGDGVYATAGSRVLVPRASTVAIEVSGKGFMRMLPNAAFLKGGSAQTYVIVGSYGAGVNYDAIGGCGCN